jgi:hypothetical protein
MNIKKQLNKIMNYVKELEMLSDKQHEELQQYQLAAYNFVNNKVRPSDTAEEFKRLLGNIMFVGGNFSNVTMEKIVDNAWVPIEHEHPEYARVVDENARLREALRWHPVNHIPINVDFVIAKYKMGDVRVVDMEYFYRAKSSGYIVKWMYIPEENDGE